MVVNPIFFNMYVRERRISNNFRLLIIEKAIISLVVFEDTRYLRLDVRTGKESNNLLLTLTLHMDNSGANTNCIKGV